MSVMPNCRERDGRRPRPAAFDFQTPAQDMAPSILTNLGCAGGAAVITVTFIHPIDTVKTCVEIKILRAFVLTYRVGLHAIDATPA